MTTAWHEGRRHLAGDHRGGEVPGRHHHDDPDWVVADEHPVDAGRRGGAVPDAHRLLGVPAEELGCVVEVAVGFGQRLALFRHEQPGQLVGMDVDQPPALAEDLAERSRGGAGGPLGFGGGGGRHAATPSSGEPEATTATADRCPGRGPRSSRRSNPHRHSPPMNRSVLVPSDSCAACVIRYTLPAGRRLVCSAPAASRTGSVVGPRCDVFGE